MLRLLMAFCFVACILAAELSIQGNDASLPKVVFTDDSQTEMASLIGSQNAINATATVHAPDFVTAEGTSVDDVGRRLSEFTCPDCNVTCPTPVCPTPTCPAPSSTRLVSSGQAGGNPPSGKSWVAHGSGTRTNDRSDSYGRQGWGRGYGLSFTSVNTGSGWGSTIPDATGYTMSWQYTVEYSS